MTQDEIVEMAIQACAFGYVYDAGDTPHLWQFDNKQLIAFANLVAAKEREALAQRTWVGLTDDEMYEAVRPLCKADSVARSLFDISKDEYRAIEAKLREKNT